MSEGTAATTKKHFVLIESLISILAGLTFARKFVLIGAMFFVPLGFAVLSQWRGATKQADFNEKEHFGVEYINPMRSLLFAVERRAVLDVSFIAHPDLKNNAKFRSEYSQIDTDIDNAIREIEQEEAKYGKALRTSEKWTVIRQGLDRFRASKPASAEEARDSYLKMIASVKDVILNQACNHSNLILDPDLNSYWLMDAFCVKLPNIGGTVSEAFLLGLTARTQADRQKLVYLHQSLPNTMEELETVNMVTAYSDDKERTNTDALKSDLDPKLQDLKNGAENFGTVINQAFLSQQDEFVDSGTITQAAMAGLNVLYLNNGFYSGVKPKLDNMILKRVKGYRSERTWTMIVSLAFGGALVFIFAAFYLGVLRSVGLLREFTNRLIAGTTETFSLAGKDEMTVIASSYNEINDALVEARRLKAQVEADNEQTQQSIMELLTVVADAGDGNLTVRATVTEGSLGNVADAFNSLMETWQQLLRNVASQLVRTSEAINDVMQSSREMAEGATNQANQVTKATQMVENMAQEILGVADTAEEATVASKQTKDSAVSGASKVDQVIQGMDALRTNVQAGAKKMKNLGDRSMEITGIVATINRIAEQTNMLALNAAIEAARAGEYGRGFSVVAEEVGKLAERAGQATLEIEKLVKAIHAETSETISAIEAQTQVVEEESQIVGQAGQQLVQIQDVSSESAGLVAKITDVARHQANNTQQVVRTMGAISSIAKKTQHGAEGSMKTIEQLVGISQELSSSMERFKLN